MTSARQRNTGDLDGCGISRSRDTANPSDLGSGIESRQPADTRPQRRGPRTLTRTSADTSHRPRFNHADHKNVLKPPTCVFSTESVMADTDLQQHPMSLPWAYQGSYGIKGKCEP